MIAYIARAAVLWADDDDKEVSASKGFTQQ